MVCPKSLYISRAVSCLYEIEIECLGWFWEDWQYWKTPTSESVFLHLLWTKQVPNLCFCNYIVASTLKCLLT